MTLWKWSLIASSNAGSDPTINWAEGQPPSSVNDSARAMMAATAKYRDDIAGALLTSGTSTAYSVSSNQVFDTLAHLDGAMIAFTPHVTNNATVTLDVDATGARPLRTAPGAELPSGTLIEGTPYVALYNNTNGEFYLVGGASFNPYSIPLGGGIPYIGSSAPNSAFALPYGQAISRTTYATLFSLVSTTFGSGDGSTTFNLPDWRGRVLAGMDNMGGSSANRLSSVFSSQTMGGTGGSQNQTVGQSNLPNVNFSVTDPGHNHVTTTSASTFGVTQTIQLATSTGGGQTVPSITGEVNLNGTATSVAGTGISVNSGGSGTALPITQPTMVVSYILRII